MKWVDEGILLAVKPLGERQVIAELLTQNHGRHLGVTALTKASRSFLMPGNVFQVTWVSRLEEQLGTFSLELQQSVAASFMTSADFLKINQLMREGLRLLLSERNPYPGLYLECLHLMQKMGKKVQLADFFRYEIKLLEEVGFGLSLDRCAVTGVKHDLTHVSPKSGSAVCAEMAAPYADKLFRLPSFLVYTAATVEPKDLLDATLIGGYFLRKHFEDVPRFKDFLTMRDHYLRTLIAAKNPRAK